MKEEIPKIHKYYPQVEVWKVCIMPDHIHMIVRVKEDLRGGQAMESLGTGARGGLASDATREMGADATREMDLDATREMGPDAGKRKGDDSRKLMANRRKEMESLGMVVKGFKLGCNRAYRLSLIHI